MGCLKFLGLEDVRFHNQDVHFLLEPKGIEKERSERLSLTHSLGYDAVQVHLEIWTELLYIEVLVHIMI